MPQLEASVLHPVGALKTLIGGGTGHDVSADPAVKAYANSRDRAKQVLDQAWNDHPVAYAAGYVPGTVMSPLNKLNPALAAGAYAEGSSNADPD